MPTELVKTVYGKFRITVEDDTDTDIFTREKSKIGIMITVGGLRKCVGINAPLGTDTANLLNVKRTGGGCELDNNEIVGEKTVGMINLAFTILKRERPDIHYIRLEDRSNIECKMKNGSIVGLSLAGQHVIFHQETWYERYFNAYLIDPILREIYIRCKGNFLKKPISFNFYNEDIKKRMNPILYTSNSWKDFFSKINIMDTKCELIFHWYTRALSEIFENYDFTTQNWMIDINNDKIKNIDYETIRRGGSRFTKKVNRYNLINEKPLITSGDISFDELMNYKYT